jgi:hypothetical protein
MLSVSAGCGSNPCKKLVDQVCGEIKNKGQCEAYQTSLGDTQADYVETGCEAALADQTTLAKIIQGMKKVGEEVQEATKTEGGEAAGVAPGGAAPPPAHP